MRNLPITKEITQNRKLIFYFVILVVLFQLLGRLFLFLNLAFTNQNGAMGILFSNEASIITSLVFLSLIWMAGGYFRNRGPIVLILAAGFSNILDRFLLEGVVDYINIGPIPSFNLPDLVIVAALIYLFFYSIKQKAPTS